MQKSNEPQNQYQIMTLDQLIKYVKTTYNISLKRDKYTKDQIVAWLENIIKLNYKINDDDTLTEKIGEPYIKQTADTDLIIDIRQISVSSINKNANFNKKHK